MEGGGGIRQQGEIEYLQISNQIISVINKFVLLSQLRCTYISAQHKL